MKQREERGTIEGTAWGGVRCVVILLAWVLTGSPMLGNTQVPSELKRTCQIQSIVYQDWQAEQISNRWVKLTIVPQLGGRLMQVAFDGHPYLFVNSKYKGKYFPPAEAGEKGRWFNYGGDKIWPMPEGTQDEHHWPGPISDALDDGVYEFKILSQSPRCMVRLDGPPDARTGLQYSREISIGDDSPRITFHSIMKNSSDHAIQWSMQTVTQYDTNDPLNDGPYNRDFWAFVPANPRSKYPDSYHVRSGLADDPSYAVDKGLFRLHWLPLENEVWLDSAGGWLAVVDGLTRYAMVEKFRYQPGAEYPGEATVIFYKNGSVAKINDQGMPALGSSPENSLHYMEAELNSPLVKLEPGVTYSMDTEWFPARVGKELSNVTEAGVVGVPLKATRTAKGLVIAGSFGVFAPGRLEARLYDEQKEQIAALSMQTVSPEEWIDLQQEIKAPRNVAWVSIHFIDEHGMDRGALGKAEVASMDRSS